MFSRSIATRTAASRLSQLSSHVHNSSYQQVQRRMASMTTATLNAGTSIPSLGFGTWQDKDEQEKAVAEALKAGYKHVRVTWL